MPWYLRKYVSIGPVRFNLSKSGIGTSVGVKGFRVGVRPNGKSYVHAGRYGLYYRQELGNIHQTESVVTNETDVLNQTDTVDFKSVASTELKSATKKDLLNQLNKSYKAFRFDYLSAVLFLILLIVVWKESDLIRILVISLGIIISITVAVWESRRRTIKITYEFDNDRFEPFEKIINAFNDIANNRKIWSMINSRHLYNTHESKLNSGASNLVDRKSATAGEGKPPWVKTNISIPAIKMGIRSLYFIPDGILVYDQNGVGFVDYEDLIIEYDTTRFIEQHPPRDSKIVGNTWKYANVGGGPDRRFKNNYQIPICLYGELKIKTDKGLLLYLMTSKDDNPRYFYEKMKNKN